MNKLYVLVLATVFLVAPVHAQSQFQTTFEAGVGYARPGIGNFDMVTLLVQGDDYLFESGIGIDINGSSVGGGDTVVSWLLRAAVRPILLGNTIVHLGGEFSLHTNSTFDPNDGVQTLTSVGVLFGVSQPLTDHFNLEMHAFPLVFGFGGADTVVKLATAQIGAHLMF